MIESLLPEVLNYNWAGPNLNRTRPPEINRGSRKIVNSVAQNKITTLMSDNEFGLLSPFHDMHSPTPESWKRLLDQAQVDWLSGLGIPLGKLDYDNKSPQDSGLFKLPHDVLQLIYKFSLEEADRPCLPPKEKTRRSMRTRFRRNRHPDENSLVVTLSPSLHSTCKLLYKLFLPSRSWIDVHKNVQALQGYVDRFLNYLFSSFRYFYLLDTAYTSAIILTSDLKFKCREFFVDDNDDVVHKDFQGSWFLSPIWKKDGLPYVRFFPLPTDLSHRTCLFFSNQMKEK